MAEDMFDVIIVGGGIAGGIAAYKLAKEGLSVLLIERGVSNGNKNMTGGRIYTHSLEKVFPDFVNQAPLERKIEKERYTWNSSEGRNTLELGETELCVKGESYSILRSGFDRWLGECAENEGAMCVTGVRVDDLLLRDGCVGGIIAGGEEMEAHVVVLADGVNSLLAQKIGLREELLPEKAEVGAKEVLELEPTMMEQILGLEPDQGLQWIFDGASCFGHSGTGFLYTNKNSISVGVLTEVGQIQDSGVAVTEMLDLLKENPEVKPLVEHAKLVEYSAHLLTKDGGGLSGLYDDGVLIIGDAAGMVVNHGYVVRGMDLAIESAILAAETIMKAVEQNDFSRNTLKDYEEAVRNSFIARELERKEPYNPQLAHIFA